MRALCVFDLDHTLVRSPLDLVRVKSEVRALVTTAGVPLPDGHGTWTIGELIAAATRHAPPLGTACWAICERHEIEALEGAVPEPGAAEALAVLQTDGYPMAVWTNNVGDVARRALERCGLDAFFPVVVTRTEAPLKPDPAGLRLLEAAFPQRPIWVVGDSWVDGAAAQAGGARFIAYGSDPAELARRGVAAQVILRDLRQLPGWLQTASW